MVTDDELPCSLNKLLNSLPRAVLIEVMYEALDLMQQWNGRSRFWCVFTALEAKEVKEGTFRVPTRKSVMEQFP